MSCPRQFLNLILLNQFNTSYSFVSEQLATKEIHVSTAQRYAHAAFGDGLDEACLTQIASLANWGKHPQNAERDLHRMMPQKLEPFSTVIEVYDPDLATVHERAIPILLASDVLHTMWNMQSAVLWESAIGATPQKCQTYWSYAANEWASQHPVVQCFG